MILEFFVKLSYEYMQFNSRKKCTIYAIPGV